MIIININGQDMLITTYSVALSARSSCVSREEGKLCFSRRNKIQLLTIDSYKLVAIKLMTASKEHLEKHYADLSDKPFFKGLVSCTSSWNGSY